MPLEVNEALLRSIALKEKTISDGRTVAKKGAFAKTTRTQDTSLVWAECQGSAKAPYQVSIDLATEKPVTRCNCPAKPPPCKHALGLLVLLMERPGQFAVGEPPADLEEKRAKAAERAEKRAETAKEPPRVNREALAKKTQEQRDALDLLETLVLDIASAGLGTVDAKRARKISEQARQMTDAYLKGAGIALERLAALATATGPVRPGRAGKGSLQAAFASGQVPDEDDWDAEYYALREPGTDLPEGPRNRLMLRHLGRLWSMVRTGKRLLDEKLEEGESPSDADAVVEELLGRDWRLVELKERGSVRRDADLIELAFEMFDDRIRQERIEHSWLVDLADGAVFVERAMRPLAALDKVRGGQSYEQVLTVAEAAVYPGFFNRRIRWDGIPKMRDASGADWERLHTVALPGLEATVAKYKEQIKNPLSPDDEAVFLLRAKDVRKAANGLVLVNEKGATLLLGDSPLARYRSTANLEIAAGGALRGEALEQPASLLVRLWLGLDDNAIYGQPLSLVVKDRRIRLGM